jgi:hypothetical protein
VVFVCPDCKRSFSLNAEFELIRKLDVMEEEFKYLEKIGNEVTISIPEKDLIYLKIMYHSTPHVREGFGQFILLAAKHGLRPIMWDDAPDYVQAQIFLAMSGEDPFVSREELAKKTGMPLFRKPPKFPLKDWKSPTIWHINWDLFKFSWFVVTPRWKRP